MQPLSNDLRERILKAIDNREGSRRKLAARFCVNPSTITRLLQLRRQTGSFDPSPDFSPGEWNRAAFCVIG
jgi:transposase